MIKKSINHHHHHHLFA